MLCKIADLIVQVPAADGMAARCSNYAIDGDVTADITICEDRYLPQRYPYRLSREALAYTESAYWFYKELTKFQGLYLHACAVVRDGKAYLFSGNSGVGKSTHANLWISTFGADTRIINDDKPALRYIDGVWYAYGTPWCGKNGINRNEKVPLAGICFLKQAGENRIRKLDSRQAMVNILRQTIFGFADREGLDAFIPQLNALLSEIPVYELECLPDPSAARLSYETMCSGAGE